MVKHAVGLPKNKQTRWRFQKLKMCKKCHRYSVLKEKNCPECGAVYTGVEALAKAIFKYRLFSETLLILMVVSISIIFAPTIEALYYSLIAGVIFALGYVILTLFFIKSEHYYQLRKLLYTDLLKIKAGIQYDIDRAEEAVKEKQVVAGYERLREIGAIIDNDSLKIRSVRALNKIPLRKNMELELEPLIPSSYDRDFVKYALEVLKIKRQLVTKKCIAYFIKYQVEIIKDFGLDLFMSVAGSALRMKLYIHEFSPFIEEYIDYFPKERFLRLCSIIHSNPSENWGSLAEKTKRQIVLKYNYDPDFKPYS